MGNKFWDRQASSYDKLALNKYAECYHLTIKNSLPYLNKDQHVLEFGCGTGITTMQIAPLVKKITAIDISHKMIEIAEHKTQNNNISNIQHITTDIFSRELDSQSFDLITAFNVLVFIKDLSPVIKRINELLKPSGIFLSATDCFSEKPSMMNRLQLLLAKLRLLPYINSLSTSCLEQLIVQNNFEVRDSATLYPKPLNFFLAAQKLPV